jgi:hypothetical protein
MSKKGKAQHSFKCGKHGNARRHGDRNVQTRYSGKHEKQPWEDERNHRMEEIQPEQQATEPEPSDEEKVGEDSRAVVYIEIGELHIHLDEHMKSVNFSGEGAKADEEVQDDEE